MPERAATTRQQSAAATPQRGGLLQRACACGNHTHGVGECKSCRKKRISLQRSPAGRDGDMAGQVAPVNVHEVLSESGSPLDVGTRAYMEPRFGQNFSHVRVHTNNRAAQSADEVDALAYTVGSNIVFNRNQYSPGSISGNRLIAHELSHVVQQSNNTGSGSLGIVAPDHPSEHEAERVASTIAESQSQNIQNHTPVSIHLNGTRRGGRRRGPTPCEPSIDDSPLDVGTAAHAQIQAFFTAAYQAFALASENHITGHVEARIPGSTKTGGAGRADLMVRRNLSDIHECLFGEIKPISWWNRGDHSRARRQLHGYIRNASAIDCPSARAFDSLTFPVESFGPYIRRPTLDLKAMIRHGIYYYYCEGPEQPEQRPRQDDSRRRQPSGEGDQPRARPEGEGAGRRVHDPEGLQTARREAAERLRRLEAEGAQAVERRLLREATEEAAQAGVRRFLRQRFPRIIAERVTRIAASRTARRAASILPLIGWVYSGEDVINGVRDIVNGHVARGLAGISCAGADVAADFLHLGDLITGPGGTIASLAVQAGTTACQIAVEMSRVNDRMQELQEEIARTGQLPPEDRLREYYEMDDEAIRELRASLSSEQSQEGQDEAPTGPPSPPADERVIRERMSQVRAIFGTNPPESTFNSFVASVRDRTIPFDLQNPSVAQAFFNAMIAEGFSNVLVNRVLRRLLGLSDPLPIP